MYNSYEQQAIDFLAKTSTTLSIDFLRYGKHFDTDTDKRDIYRVTLTRGSRSYSTEFGQCLKDSGWWLLLGSSEHNKRSINVPFSEYMNDKPKHLTALCRQAEASYSPKCDTIKKPVAPTAYDVLACLQKYDGGSFEDFCSEFGYDTDSIRASKIYDGVCAEYNGLCLLYSEAEMDELREIQ